MNQVGEFARVLEPGVCSDDNIRFTMSKTPLPILTHGMEGRELILQRNDRMFDT